MKFLVMSCDKNMDLFPIFYHCLEKYWPDHPEVIYSTETETNPYYKTVCSGEKSWGLRMKDCLDIIDDDLILVTVDDFFIREPVNNKLVEHCTEIMYEDASIGYLDIEGNYLKDKVISYNTTCDLFNANGMVHKASVIINLFRKDCLYKLCNDVNPWQFELQWVPTEYKYLITKTEAISFGIGKLKENMGKWGLVSGKWTEECVAFLQKEGLNIDFGLRGFY